jgi:hypothetical protein
VWVHLFEYRDNARYSIQIIFSITLKTNLHYIFANTPLGVASNQGMSLFGKMQLLKTLAGGVRTVILVCTACFAHNISGLWTNPGPTMSADASWAPHLSTSRHHCPVPDRSHQISEHVPCPWTIKFLCVSGLCARESEGLGWPRLMAMIQCKCVSMTWHYGLWVCTCCWQPRYIGNLSCCSHCLCLRHWHKSRHTSQYPYTWSNYISPARWGWFDKTPTHGLRIRARTWKQSCRRCQCCTAFRDWDSYYHNVGNVGKQSVMKGGTAAFGYCWCWQ